MDISEEYISQVSDNLRYLLREKLCGTKVDRSIRWIDFEVVDGNPAVAFYESLGYQIEGRKRGAIKVNDDLKDLLIMAKLMA